MQIITDDRPQTNWITAIVDGRWCQAKLFDEGSIHGINDGRISKLVIGKGPSRNPSEPFFDQMAYNYDRGLDFDDLPEGVLDLIVAQFEALPPAFTQTE
jgi:hypothetical protein